ncbi:RDD family protein [Nocardia sp. NPDC003345]
MEIGDLGAGTEEVRGREPDEAGEGPDASDRPGTRISGSELMTAQWSPRHEAAHVPFGLFAAAFAIDIALHVAAGVVAWYVLWQSPDPAVSPIIMGVIAGIGASFAHRTLAQRAFRTTVGKAIFGLQLRRADGTYPGLSSLVKQWLIGALATVGAPLRLLS